MSQGARVAVEPISAQDLHDVSAFLHEHLNQRISARAWAEMSKPSWDVEAPNHGFMLRAAGDIVGVHLAFYSQREINGRVEDFCNLGAWCVADSHRAGGLRLLRAILAQPGYHFTDFSPSGNVVAINRRLGFEHLDTSTALEPHFPLPSRRGAKIVTDHRRIRRTLRGADLQRFLDHETAAAAHQLVLVSGEAVCHVVFRRVRRRDLPIFAALLHVSDPSLFLKHQRMVYQHFLLRHGLLATLVELRVVEARPHGSRLLTNPRPKMYRSPRLGPCDIDYLYSELTCVAW